MSIEAETEVDIPGAGATNLFDYIVDFLRSDQLRSPEDQGMARQLLYNDHLLGLQALSTPNGGDVILMTGNGTIETALVISVLSSPATETESLVAASALSVQPAPTPMVADQVTGLVRLTDVAALLPR